MKAPTPKELGYHMPAEWEPHEATWLAWPHMRYARYWGDNLEPVQDISLQIIKALYRRESVHLMVVDEAMEKEVRKKAGKAKIPLEHVVFYEIPTIDVWTRDHGPIFVINRGKQDVAITHWLFNGWGNKYPDLMPDTMVPAKIHEVTQIPYFSGGMVLEGGSIEVNGQGVLLTTKQCLLNKNRNPYLKKPDIENKLKDYLGVKNIVWLNHGLVNDDTDGHIDNLARFISADAVAVPYEWDAKDDNYASLNENYEILKKTSKVFIYKLPTPGYIADNGKRLAASYANFYIANNAVLLPVFGNKRNDRQAKDVLENLFPDRKIILINCLPLIKSGGTIHCITQQQPKGSK